MRYLCDESCKVLSACLSVRLSVRVFADQMLGMMFRSRIYSHQAKVGTKAEMIKEQAKRPKKKKEANFVKGQRKVSIPHPFSLGVNGRFWPPFSVKMHIEFPDKSAQCNSDIASLSI